MIITQPPDAKLPLHLHAYASTTQLTQSDDHSNIIHDYPPSNHRPASIADSELPPAYIDPSSSADEDRRPLNPRLAAMTPKQRQRRKRRFRIMAGSVLAVYVLSTSTLLVLFWVCARRRPASRMMTYPLLCRPVTSLGVSTTTTEIGVPVTASSRLSSHRVTVQRVQHCQTERPSNATLGPQNRLSPSPLPPLQRRRPLHLHPPTNQKEDDDPSNPSSPTTSDIPSVPTRPRARMP